MRDLEDALAALQSKHSKESHPLLEAGDASLDADDVGTENTQDADREPLGGEGEREKGKEPDQTVIADAFGTLSIAEHGVSRFYGPTGGIEVRFVIPSDWEAWRAHTILCVSQSLLIGAAQGGGGGSRASESPFDQFGINNHAGSLSPPTSSTSYQSSSSYAQPSSSSLSSTYPGQNSIPQSITPNPAPLFSRIFPFTPLGATPDILETIRTHLPPPARARQLLAIYFEQAYWLFRGVTKEQAYGELVPGVYGAEARGWWRAPGQDDEDAEGEQDVDEDSMYELGPHDVAVLFLLFAIGAVLEPTPGSKAGAGAATSGVQMPGSGEVPGQPYGQSVYGPYHPGVAMAGSSPSGFSSKTHSAGSSPSNQAHAQSRSQSHSQAHPNPYSQAHPHPQHRPTSQSPNTLSLQSALHQAQLLGEHYHQLGQASLCLQPVLEQPGVATVQGLHLMSIFNAFAESERSDASSMEASWSLITMAANLSQTASLYSCTSGCRVADRFVCRSVFIGIVHDGACRRSLYEDGDSSFGTYSSRTCGQVYIPVDRRRSRWSMSTVTTLVIRSTPRIPVPIRMRTITRWRTSRRFQRQPLHRQRRKGGRPLDRRGDPTQRVDPVIMVRITSVYSLFRRARSPICLLHRRQIAPRKIPIVVVVVKPLSRTSKNVRRCVTFPSFDCFHPLLWMVY